MAVTSHRSGHLPRNMLLGTRRCNTAKGEAPAGRPGHQGALLRPPAGPLTAGLPLHNSVPSARVRANTEVHPSLPELSEGWRKTGSTAHLNSTRGVAAGRSLFQVSTTGTSNPIRECPGPAALPSSFLSPAWLCPAVPRLPRQQGIQGESTSRWGS